MQRPNALIKVLNFSAQLLLLAYIFGRHNLRSSLTVSKQHRLVEHHILLGSYKAKTIREELTLMPLREWGFGLPEEFKLFTLDAIFVFIFPIVGYSEKTKHRVVIISDIEVLKLTILFYTAIVGMHPMMQRIVQACLAIVIQSERIDNVVALIVFYFAELIQMLWWLNAKFVQHRCKTRINPG